MSDDREKKSSSSHANSAAGLLLRIRHSNGRTEEFYLANGLTIGRTVANTVILPDDEAVDRTHARIDFQEDGMAHLRCLPPDNVIFVGAEAVCEIHLTVGVAFRIGNTHFECTAGLRESSGDRPFRGECCPHCRSEIVPAARDIPSLCPNCRQAVIALNLDGEHTAMLIPAKFGEFFAERFIAHGGMGIVLRGHAITDKTPVAIKILMPGNRVDRQAEDRFQQEIALMQRVQHPNVVRLLAYGRSGFANYLIMEWVEGMNLRDAVANWNRRQELPRFEEVLPWLKQVCNGLEAVHTVGIVHRDIKPSNILVCRDGRVLLTDLGVAKSVRQQTAMTMTGQLPGTFEYMAPEQFNAPDTVDRRTDLYSLGVTFYELFTAERPMGTWIPASQANRTVPRAFDGIFAKLLARRPENRYADIQELMAAIFAITRSRQQSAFNGPSSEGDSVRDFFAISPTTREAEATNGRDSHPHAALTKIEQDSETNSEAVSPISSGQFPLILKNASGDRKSSNADQRHDTKRPAVWNGQSIWNLLLNYYRRYEGLHPKVKKEVIPKPAIPQNAEPSNADHVIRLGWDDLFVTSPQKIEPNNDDQVVLYRDRKRATEKSETPRSSSNARQPRKNSNSFLSGKWIVLILLSVGLGIIREAYRDSQANNYAPPMRPQFVLNTNSRDNPGLFSDSVTSYGTVTNFGGPGNVIVESWLTENGQEVERQQTKIFLLNAGERKEFSFEMSKIHSVKNPHKVEARAFTP